MKKIIHKDVLGRNPRKREVSVDETVYRIGRSIHKRRSCKYFIEESKVSEDPLELQRWIEQEKKYGLKKNSHVFRELNTETGINKVICKVIGEFFAVRGNTAFKIFYVNEIKLEMDANNTEQE
ncbi:MAG TPA: hypothetical protein PKZ41_00270 [Candidatus Omnitrophota bacterium]|nr:hypothetical protein [Candidatus Omnitrophota bacterium]